MQRTIFDRSVMDGFRGSRVESVVSIAHGRKIFLAVNDGAITTYNCSLESNSAGRIYVCKDQELFRKPSKDKKTCAPLLAVESWRAVVCIADGVLTAYDAQFGQSVASIPDNKGVHLFAVYEKQDSLLIINKKKLVHYSWSSPGFQLRKEYNLADVPKSLHHIAGTAIIGYKKYYECLDLSSGITSRLVDFEREHKMIVAEIPANIYRSERILISVGQQGLLVDRDEILAGSYIYPTEKVVPKVEWGAPPNAVNVMTPFLLSTLSDTSVEVHDLLSLTLLQKVVITSLSGYGLTLSVCCEDITRGQAAGSPFLYHAFLCNGDQMFALRMTSLSSQVHDLVAYGMFEEAIQLCSLCPVADKRDINMIQLHESAANTMMSKGEYGKAVEHYIQAQTSFLIVAKQFPDFIPLSLHVMFGIMQTTKLAGTILQKAAAAAATFCQYHRARMNRRGEKAEKMKELGIIAASSVLNASYSMSSKAKSRDYSEDEDYIADPDEELKKCVLLDSMLLFALMHCANDRKPEVLQLLSGPNRCQIETCAVLLASHGNTYTEALLWLYRSQHQHARVLQALTEDKCVAIGAWSRDQFYCWTADYLRWLWYNEEDNTLPRQALFALKPVLEYDAELGLSVLVSRPTGKTSFGGKGVTIGEVLTFLRSCSPRINYGRGSINLAVFRGGHSAISNSQQTMWAMENSIAQVLASIPLATGHALAVAFLECLVASGEAPPSLHDDFARLLVEGIVQSPFPPTTPAETLPEDVEDLLLYKIYRKKLQAFLANSNAYHPQAISKMLSKEYYLENALILAKLGRHRDVLVIYIKHLKKLDLAETYCDKVYTVLKDHPSNLAMNMKTSLMGILNSNMPPGVTIALDLAATLSEPSEIYLIMFQVILDEEEEENDNGSDSDSLLSPSAQPSENVRVVVSLAEKYFDRFDATALLELLPRDIPVASLLHYFLTVLEYGNCKRRNLQILHHLLRVREVAVRTSDFIQLTPQK